MGTRQTKTLGEANNGSVRSGRAQAEWIFPRELEKENPCKGLGEHQRTRDFLK